MTTNAPEPSDLDRLQFTFTRGVLDEYKRKFRNYRDFSVDMFLYQYTATSATKSITFDVFSFDFSKSNVKTTKHYRALIALLAELNVPYQEKEAGPKPGHEQHAHYHSLEIDQESLEQAIEAAGIDNVLARFNEKIRAMPDVGVMPPQAEPPAPPPRDEPENLTPPPPPPRKGKAAAKPAAAKAAARDPALKAQREQKMAEQKMRVFMRSEKTYMAQTLDLAMRQEALRIAQEEAKDEKQKKALQTQLAQVQRQQKALEDKAQKLEKDMSVLVSSDDLEQRKKAIQAEVVAQAEIKLTAAAKPVITQAYKLDKQTEGKTKNKAQQSLEEKLALQEKQLRAQAEFLLGDEADEKVKAVEQAVIEQMEKQSARGKPTAK